MKLIILFGPPAVGKMTVGRELCRITGYKLLHNHMTIDLAIEIFPWRSVGFEAVVPELRRTIVRAAAEADLPGLVFTFVWDFAAPADQAFLDELKEINAEYGGETLYAELQAPGEVRVQRHDTELRRLHKPRLVADVSAESLRNEGTRRRVSGEDFPYPDRHIRIENTHVSPEDAARRIAERFGLLG